MTTKSMLFLAAVITLLIVGYAWLTRPVQSPCPPGLKATQEGCK